MANSNPSPIIQPDLPFATWNSTQIYDPAYPDGTGIYVPNVNDIIFDFVQGMFIVTSVDYTTGASNRRKWELPLQPSGNDNEDVLLGSGPGTISDSYRACINSSLRPSPLSLDRRLRLYGTTTSSIKVFRGTDISAHGEVISKFYDQNWNLLGDSIPLELVAMNDATNFAVKAPKVGYTTANVSDGELLTVVTYDDVGTVVSTAKMLAQNTSFIRTSDASTKYIRSISVKCAFLNPSDPTNIQFPINMPVENLNMIGVVTYSDGTTLELPVDGTKFMMYGLDNYIATEQGQRIPLVLVYNLSANEYNYIGVPSTTRAIAEEYSATTMPTDGAYSVKLFVYPVWQDSLNGYRLQYYLYNLDRQDVYDVTNIAQADTDARPFNPTQYNVYQTVAVAVDLNRVDPAFAPLRHVQTVGITLQRPGNDYSGDNWTVAYTPGQSPAYGVGTLAKVRFVDATNWKLDLSSGCTTLAEWLDRCYYAAQPLFDSRSEIKAPVPNIMRINVNGTRYEFPVGQWSSSFTVGQSMAEGSNVYVEWVLRDSENDLQLGVSAFIVHQQQNPQV